MSSFGGEDRFELVPDVRASRGTATINVSHADKEVFDAVKLWLQHREGRALAQWDVFSFLLGAALADESLRGVRLFDRA